MLMVGLTCRVFQGFHFFRSKNTWGNSYDLRRSYSLPTKFGACAFEANVSLYAIIKNFFKDIWKLNQDQTIC